MAQLELTNALLYDLHILLHKLLFKILTNTNYCFRLQRRVNKTDGQNLTRFSMSSEKVR